MYKSEKLALRDELSRLNTARLREVRQRGSKVERMMAYAILLERRHKQ